MTKSTGSTSEETEFLAEGFPNLSRNVRDFVRGRPREARLAVAVALETADFQDKAEAGGGGEVPKKLHPFIVRGNRDDAIFGVSAAAVRLKVARTTVYDCVDRNPLRAWRSTKRDLSIPAVQILGPGRGPRVLRMLWKQ